MGLKPRPCNSKWPDVEPCHSYVQDQAAQEYQICTHVIFVNFMVYIYVQCQKRSFNFAHANSISCLLFSFSIGYISFWIHNNSFEMVLNFGLRFSNNRLGLYFESSIFSLEFILNICAVCLTMVGLAFNL